MEQEKQMAEERRKQFLRKLEQKARKARFEAKLVPPEGDREGEREALHVLLPMTGEGGVCLMELMAVPFVDGTEMLIFYTTILEEAGPGRDALNAVLSEWNLACPMGAFGLFRADGGEQLFHKYSTLIDLNENPEVLADGAVFHVRLLGEIISRKYREACRLAKGEA